MCFRIELNCLIARVRTGHITFAAINAQILLRNQDEAKKMILGGQFYLNQHNQLLQITEMCRFNLRHR